MLLFVIIRWLLVGFALLLTGCGEPESPAPSMKMNNEPKYSSENSISLNLNFKIDLDDISQYYVSERCKIDADGKYIYVLDNFESSIHIFSNTGKYLRSFGQKGKKRFEIENAESFFIADQNIYIHDRYLGFKEFTLSGAYKRLYPYDRADFLEAKYTNSEIFINEVDIRGKSQTWELTRFSKEFEKKRLITRVILDAKQDHSFNFYGILAVDSKNCAYFPVKRDEYVINKYNPDGELLFSFGRQYITKSYSERAKNQFNKNNKLQIEEGLAVQRPDNPPIIRHLLVDDKDNVWVVVGEWSGDVQNVTSFDTTIDIFSSDGEFLYTFTTNKITMGSKIVNGMLYVQPTSDHRFLDVYEIVFAF